MFVSESKTATFSVTIFSLKKSERKNLFWCKETALLECEGCLLGWAGTQSGSHQQLHSEVLYSKWGGNYQTVKLKKYINILNFEDLPLKLLVKSDICQKNSDSEKPCILHKKHKYGKFGRVEFGLNRDKYWWYTKNLLLHLEQYT